MCHQYQYYYILWLFCIIGNNVQYENLAPPSTTQNLHHFFYHFCIWFVQVPFLLLLFLLCMIMYIPYKSGCEFDEFDVPFDFFWYLDIWSEGAIICEPSMNNVRVWCNWSTLEEETLPVILEEMVVVENKWENWPFKTRIHEVCKRTINKIPSIAINVKQIINKMKKCQ